VLVDIDTKDEGNPPTKTTEAFQTLVNSIKSDFLAAYSLWHLIYTTTGDQSVVDRINRSDAADFANVFLHSLTEALIVKLCTCTFGGGNPKEQSASIQTASTWLQDSEFLNGLKESFLRQAWRDPNEISISLCNDSVGIDRDRLLLVAREELDRDCHDDNSKLEPRFNASIDLLTKDLFVRLKPAKREKIANVQSEFKCLCESNERAMHDACYIGKPSAAAIELLWIKEARNKAAAHRDFTHINGSLSFRSLGDFNIQWTRIEVLIADLTRAVQELEYIANGRESSLGDWISRMHIQCQTILQNPILS
jgi:hypothetical protein